MRPSFQRAFLVLAAMVFVASNAGRFSRAADDVAAVVEPAQAQNGQMAGIAVENFDQWVFPNVGNKAAALKTLETRLTLEMRQIQRRYQLTEAQSSRLQMAGRSDISRFLRSVEVSRTKFLKMRDRGGDFNEIWQDISPLQTQFQRGLFTNESLLKKSLRRALNEKQQAAFDSTEAERRAFLAETSRLAAVNQLETTIPMLERQREGLMKLMRDRRFPKLRLANTNYAGYAVLMDLNSVEDVALADLFDKQELAAVRQRTAQFQGWEQLLRQQGAVEDEEPAAVPNDDSPASAVEPANAAEPGGKLLPAARKAE